MTEEPTNDMLVHCGNCRHEWFALNTPILLHLAVERINKMRCPECNELPSNIFCGPAPVNTSAERVKKTGDLNMSDDLVKRLREEEGWYLERAAREAADRIEQDAQHIDEMYGLVAAMNADHTANKNRIEKLEAALREIDEWAEEQCYVGLRKLIRKALEGKDD